VHFRKAAAIKKDSAMALGEMIMLVHRALHDGLTTPMSCDWLLHVGGAEQRSKCEDFFRSSGNAFAAILKIVA
jgi:hypothetical protein